MTAPMGCTHCGVEYRGHCQRWLSGVGWHGWAEPTRAQIAERLRARLNTRRPRGRLTLRKPRTGPGRPEEYSVNETETQTPATPKEVRAWAAKNGFEVGARGRISRDVKAAFERSTGRLAA